MSVEISGRQRLVALWQRRVRAPLIAQLRQGVSPHQLALTLALGAVLGLFPIWGMTTVICGVAALWLRLNQPLIQAINYLLAPLHLLLLLPFYRAGEVLFRQPPVPLFSVSELIERFRASPLQFFVDYGLVGLYGIVVWLLVAVPLAWILYVGAKPLVQRLARRA